MHTPHQLTRRARYAGAALAVAAIGGLNALPASADGEIIPEVDSVRIESVGFDLGGEAFSNGSPTASATVSWAQAWFGAVPDFDGWLHFEGVADACARVKMASYDENDQPLGDPVSTGPICAPDNGHHAESVHLDGAAGAHKVSVRLQSLAANGDWQNVGTEESETYGPLVDTDHFTIERPTYDLGGGSLVGGSPTAGARLSWNVSSEGVISPRLTGTLFIDDTDLCARITMHFIPIGGDNQLQVRHSGYWCGHNDTLQTYSVDLEPYESTNIAEVKVIIEEEQPGPTEDWQWVGNTTLTLN